MIMMMRRRTRMNYHPEIRMIGINEMIDVDDNRSVVKNDWEKRY